MKNRTEKRFTKKYINEIRSLLPFSGKKERFFLNSMKKKILSYSVISEVNCMDDIYNEFGFPQEAVFNYISAMENKSLLETLKKSRKIHRLIVIICIIVFFATLSFSLYGISEYIQFKNAEVFSIESEITRIE